MDAILFVILLAPVLYSSPASSLGTTVRCPAGTVAGRTVDFDGVPVRAFLGIPYAEPPVGPLRFRKPVPLEDPYFPSPFEATSLGPGCPQYYTARPGPTYDTLPGISEDCLYLNVWVPASASPVHNEKSVMFWVHTGAFAHSSSRLDFTQGQVLAALGDVVVVTINYRLGALGFFYAGTSQAPGNMGLLDMVAALRWVRRNIGAFGGDADSVTLFGHSAGAIAVGMLTVSPLTRGHFRRAVLMSLAPTTTDGADNTRASRTSEQLARAVGCSGGDGGTLESDPDAVVECMRNVSAYDLTVQLSRVSADSGYQRPFYPRFGDEVLPEDPRLAVARGDFAPLDLLVGSVTGEGSPLLTSAYPEVFGPYGEKRPCINRTFGAQVVREQLRRYPGREEAVGRYLDGVDPEDCREIRKQAFTAVGDFFRLCPAVYCAESFAERNPNVFYYYFNRPVSNTPYAPWMLAVHFYDVPFVFGYPLRYPSNYTCGERETSRRMIRYWTNFAKTGLPDDDWPRYSKARPVFRYLDTCDLDPDKYGTGPHRDKCDFFRSYFGF